MPDYEYMTEAAAAAYLDVTLKTLQKWRYLGMLDMKGTSPPRSYKRGRHIWYIRSEIDAWIRGGEVI